MTHARLGAFGEVCVCVAISNSAGLLFLFPHDGLECHADALVTFRQVKKINRNFPVNQQVRLAHRHLSGSSPGRVLAHRGRTPSHLASYCDMSAVCIIKKSVR